MRIAYLAAGAGGMYCGSCLHDNTLAAELLRQGHDVVLVPIYTPLRTDEKNVSLHRVFFGGINVYLQQKWSFFRRTPRWLDNWIDHPALLRLVSGHSGSVDPARLGAMTVSMLRGEEGYQRKEIEKLVDWLVDEIRPDVVHLSNSLMIGLARMIGKRCGPPVVCSLSGEDLFLEKLTAPYYEHARELLRERAGDVQAFVALNNYYANFMSQYLGVGRDRVHVIPHGLSLEGHARRQQKPADAPRRVGFLARICADKGLHLLVEACELLAERPALPSFELHTAGYLGAGDKPYFRDIQRRVSRGPLAGRFHYIGEPNRTEKIEFLQSLDVFSTPTVYRESKGLPALEALANGVAVVLPDHGSFSEMVHATKGGLLCRPHSPLDLADKLAELLENPDLVQQLGEQGRRVVHEDFNVAVMASRTLNLYHDRIVGSSRSASS